MSYKISPLLRSKIKNMKKFEKCSYRWNRHRNSWNVSLTYRMFDRRYFDYNGRWDFPLFKQIMPYGDNNYEGDNLEWNLHLKYRFPVYRIITTRYNDDMQVHRSIPRSKKPIIPSFKPLMNISDLAHPQGLFEKVKCQYFPEVINELLDYRDDEAVEIFQ